MPTNKTAGPAVNPMERTVGHTEVEERPLFRYNETPAWYRYLVLYAETNGMAKAFELGRKALKDTVEKGCFKAGKQEFKVRAPANNPFHAIKQLGKEKDLLLLAYYILAVKKDNPTGNTHVLVRLMRKLAAVGITKAQLETYRKASKKSGKPTIEVTV
jgi:hypothetical protein